MTSELQSTAPETIYLNYGDDAEASYHAHSEMAEVTWTADEPATNVAVEYRKVAQPILGMDRVQELITIYNSRIKDVMVDPSYALNKSLAREVRDLRDTVACLAALLREQR